MEVTFSTDFALVQIYQTDAGPWAETYVFATSAPGSIALECGHRYARPTVRLERWDSEPPPIADEWEDFDELPFVELPDAGPLVIRGSDGPQPDEQRLDIAGLGRARAQVFARGRHAASDGDGPVDQPETWLVRLWPDLQHHDALWGGPRTIHGAVEQEFPLTDGRAFVSAEEVAHVLRWTAPGDLQPSVRRIADRLGMTRLSVRQGLDTIDYLVTHQEQPSPFVDGLPLDDDTPFRFARPSHHGGLRYDAYRQAP